MAPYKFRIIIIIITLSVKTLNSASIIHHDWTVL